MNAERRRELELERDLGLLVKCKLCGGHGKYLTRWHAQGAGEVHEHQCPACDGFGWRKPSVSGVDKLLDMDVTGGRGR